MRHTHWWGAAAGVVTLAGAAYVAPAAVAAGVAAPHKPRAATSVLQTVRYGKATAKSKPGTPPQRRPQAGRRGGGHDDHGTSHGNGQGNGNGNGNSGHGHHGKPPYPPGRSSAVSIDVPSKVHRGKAVTVSTRVSVNNRALGGVKVALYASRDGETWKLVATTTTRPNGTASFDYTVKRDTLVRVVVAGSRTSQASQSTAAKISVKH